MRTELFVAPICHYHSGPYSPRRCVRGAYSSSDVYLVYAPNGSEYRKVARQRSLTADRGLITKPSVISPSRERSRLRHPPSAPVSVNLEASFAEHRLPVGSPNRRTRFRHGGDLNSLIICRLPVLAIRIVLFSIFSRALTSSISPLGVSTPLLEFFERRATGNASENCTV